MRTTKINKPNSCVVNHQLSTKVTQVKQNPRHRMRQARRACLLFIKSDSKLPEK